MITAIQAAYPPKADKPCISPHIDVLFHIYDPPLPESSDPVAAIKRNPCAKRIGAPELTDLAVHNPKEHRIHLIAIDSCLYDSSDTTRCDCALVREQEIQFVEFKHGNYRRRSERIKDCIPQLAATINDFFRVGILAPKSVVLAIACVGFQEEFPPRSASLEARIVQLNNLVEADVVVELRVTDSTIFE